MTGKTSIIYLFFNYLTFRCGKVECSSLCTFLCCVRFAWSRKVPDRLVQAEHKRVQRRAALLRAHLPRPGVHVGVAHHRSACRALLRRAQLAAAIRQRPRHQQQLVDKRRHVQPDRRQLLSGQLLAAVQALYARACARPQALVHHTGARSEARAGTEHVSRSARLLRAQFAAVRDSHRLSTRCLRLRLFIRALVVI